MVRLMHVLLLAICATMCAEVHASDQFTYIKNSSTKTITATITYKNFLYSSGQSQFVNRVIAPETQQSDEYDAQVATGFAPLSVAGPRLGTGVVAPPADVPLVHIEIWVEGAKVHNSVEVSVDKSIVAKDGQNNGVDIFQSVYGQLDTSDGPALVTIYP